MLEGKLANKHAQRAFLSGVIRGTGSLGVEADGLSVIIQHPSDELILKCAELIKTCTGHAPEIIKKDKDRALGSRTVYELKLAGAHCKKLLMETGITTAPLQIAESVPAFTDDACKRAYVKGLFLASGTLTVGKDAEASGYLMEISVSSETVAEGVGSFLQEVDILPKYRMKNGTPALYIKDSDQIGDFLAYMGANRGYFALQDILLSRSVNNMVNRRVNCDMANVDRARLAAEKQLAAIRTIDEHYGLQNLEPALRLTALARLENPAGTVAEILDALENPPTKSGLNHRMRKLIELAETLKKEADEN